MRDVPLILVGFMGCGKSTVGRLLAQRLDWPFVDLDDQIEAAAGRTIREIFESSGEAEFRRQERVALQALLASATQDPHRVIALGGGTFVQPDNFELLQSASVRSLFLDVPFDELYQRCAQMTNRPLFRDAQAFADLYRRRLPFYQQAQYTIAAAAADPEQIVDRIVERIACPQMSLGKR